MKPGPVLKKSRKNNPFEKYSVHNYENLSALFEEEQKNCYIWRPTVCLIRLIHHCLRLCIVIKSLGSPNKHKNIALKILSSARLQIQYQKCSFLSQGDAGLAAKCLFELINEKPVKIAILGPPKSNPYEIVGQITPKFYLTQVRFSTT